MISSSCPGSSTALAVCSKKHWPESCTFNLTDKSSTDDLALPTPTTADGERGNGSGNEREGVMRGMTETEQNDRSCD